MIMKNASNKAALLLRLLLIYIKANHLKQVVLLLQNVHIKRVTTGRIFHLSKRVISKIYFDLSAPDRLALSIASNVSIN